MHEPPVGGNVSQRRWIVAEAVSGDDGPDEIEWLTFRRDSHRRLIRALN
jgi:hypothetical protein